MVAMPVRHRTEPSGLALIIHVAASSTAGRATFLPARKVSHVIIGQNATTEFIFGEFRVGSVWGLRRVFLTLCFPSLLFPDGFSRNSPPSWTCS